MILKRKTETYILVILLCAMLTGCHTTQAQYADDACVIDGIREESEAAENAIDAYQQMTLYIQEGFRMYAVEGRCQAYFGTIEEGAGDGAADNCQILLAGEDCLWTENIAYTYDEPTGWYTFEGIYEPIFTHDTSWAAASDSSYAADMMENYVNKAEITQDADYGVPIRYYSDNGPVEQEDSLYYPHMPDTIERSYSVIPMLYTYQDERMDVNITIQYPLISYPYQSPLADNGTEAAVNERLKEAFFYGYGTEDSLTAGSEMYLNLHRQYFITREDDNYFSLRIYEDNYSRGANHPNEWETGITINMKTGGALQLKDVAGPDWTPESLLDSGAFKYLWTWEMPDCAEWIEQIRPSLKEETLHDYNRKFYLTDKSLGLITGSGRYYACMEAVFADLGLTEFIK